MEQSVVTANQNLVLKPRQYTQEVPLPSLNNEPEETPQVMLSASQPSGFKDKFCTLKHAITLLNLKMMSWVEMPGGLAQPSKGVGAHCLMPKI